LRGNSHVTYASQRTLCTDCSNYRSRDSVRDRTRRSSPKSDTQRSKELKRKISAATTAAPCARGRARRIRSLAIATSARNGVYGTRGNVRGTRRSTYSRAASIKRFMHTSAPVTAPPARGCPRRVHGSATVQDTRNNVYIARANVRNTSGSAATYYEEYCKSSNCDRAGAARTFAARARVKTYATHRPKRFQAPRARATRATLR
jgi:hypothetical protein